MAASGFANVPVSRTTTFIIERVLNHGNAPIMRQRELRVIFVNPSDVLAARARFRAVHDVSHAADFSSAFCSSGAAGARLGPGTAWLANRRRRLAALVGTPLNQR